MQPLIHCHGASRPENADFFPLTHRLNAGEFLELRERLSPGAAVSEPPSINPPHPLFPDADGSWRLQTLSREDPRTAFLSYKGGAGGNPAPGGRKLLAQALG